MDQKTESSFKFGLAPARKGLVILKLHVFFSRLCSIRNMPKLAIFVLKFSSLLQLLGVKIFSELEFSQLSSSISLKKSKVKKNKKLPESLEVIVLSSGKDLELLEDCLKYAAESLHVFSSLRFSIIVPHANLLLTQRMFFENPSIYVICEDSLISQNLITQLKNLFGARYTWVLQQIIKLKYTYISGSEYILLLDADTMLLNSRNWIDGNRRQILMPSLEFTPSYYRFLSQLGVCENVPRYSFVSHHMLIESKEFRQMFKGLGFENVDDFITFSINNAEMENQSPFSIDYELYSQYLFNRRPEKIFLEKWSNLSLPRRSANKYLTSKFRMCVLKFFYNSVSFHSWS